MHVFPAITFVLAYAFPFISALNCTAPSHIAIMNHVLPLTIFPLRHPYPTTPSSKYLHKRSNSLTPLTTATLQDEPPADIQQDLLTLSGRVYMTNVTLAGFPYTLVIDTGSSDTWVASSTFQCLSTRRISLPQSACGFSTLYDKYQSETYERIPTHDFGIRYTDGEYLEGELGTEELGIGERLDGQGTEGGVLKVRQTIGVVEQGWWMGDRISSGLMGLAYPMLASGAGELNYSSLVFTLFANSNLPPIFTLALTRPTPSDPLSGGLLALGGISDLPHGPFINVPIKPLTADKYAWYSIVIDGFEIIPPDPAPPRSRSRWQNPGSWSRKTAERQTSRDPTPLTMILDSGSTNNYFPPRVADSIAAAFVPPATYSRVNNVYSVPCNAAAPRVGVVIAGQTFWIDERDLVLRGFLGRGDLCGVSVQRILGAEGEGEASMAGVLGDSWLRGVLAVFDVGVGEIRVAAREGD